MYLCHEKAQRTVAQFHLIFSSFPQVNQLGGTISTHLFHFFCFSSCSYSSATATTPNLVCLYGHHSSKAPPVLLWETQVPFNAKGIFFFFDKSTFVVTPNLMRELHVTKDCSLCFLGLRNLCALQVFSSSIFGGWVSQFWMGCFRIIHHRTQAPRRNHTTIATPLQLPKTL